jgi:hypothetical protein
MDEARSAFSRRTPEAQYPDGYLGVGGPPSRRQRLLDADNAVQSARKPTDRGVHRDAQLQAEDYIWPNEFNLYSGLEYEVAGMQFISPAMVNAAGLIEEETAPPERINELRKLLPQWASAGPGMSVLNYMSAGQ